ncbi:MAG TPA: DMT family transporter [Casimicrobiaceae bacterium]|nr:DMT family transporter [Casimicrobiaceae bacterium]
MKLLASSSQRTQGLVLLLSGTALIAVMDALVKLLSHSYSTLQIAWGRYAVSAILLFLVIEPRRSFARLRTRRLSLHLLRTALLLSATVCFFAALRTLSLADANAIFFSSPLLITVLSCWILRESIGARRWLAVLAGFAGVLLVMRPGSGTLGAAALLPLIAASCSALYHVMTPVLARTEDPANTLHFMALVAGVGLLPVVPFFWTAFDAAGAVGIVAIGTLGTAGHFLLIRAFQTVPASTLSPFLYVYLVWATILGWLIFSDVPSVATIAGAVVIIASGLYVYRQPIPAAGEIEPITATTLPAPESLTSMRERSVE